MLWKTPTKHTAHYKRLLLALQVLLLHGFLFENCSQIWSGLAELHMGALFAPVALFPLIGVYSKGLLSITRIPPHYSVVGFTFSLISIRLWNTGNRARILHTRSVVRVCGLKKVLRVFVTAVTNFQLVARTLLLHHYRFSSTFSLSDVWPYWIFAFSTATKRYFQPIIRWKSWELHYILRI